jgi:hypothetical protein
MNSQMNHSAISLFIMRRTSFVLFAYALLFVNAMRFTQHCASTLVPTVPILNPRGNLESTCALQCHRSTRLQWHSNSLDATCMADSCLQNDCCPPIRSSQQLQSCLSNLTDTGRRSYSTRITVFTCTLHARTCPENEYNPSIPRGS